MNIQTQGWQDLQVAQPIDPKSIILSVALNSTTGTWQRSTNALQTTWAGTNALAFTGNNTSVASYDLTDGATVVDAAQWTIAHQMVNASSNIPPSMNKVVFVRAGEIWDNKLEINFGASSYNNVQLTFRDNLGTSGQFVNGATGGVPVYNFGNGITGNQILHLTLLRPGVYNMVFLMVLSSNWSTYDFQLIVLP
ncbi:MAG: hypothetical protein WCH46_00370 [bacterium]